MRKVLILLVLSVVMCGTVSVAAPQERSDKVATEKEESPIQVVAKWANFVVLFGGLIYLLRKPMGEFFANRRKDIASGLERAQRAQTSAQARMDEIEQRLATLSTEITTLKTEAERDSLAEREKILAEARHEVERVIE